MSDVADPKDLHELEAKAVVPIERNEHSMNVWRRIAFLFRRAR